MENEVRLTNAEVIQACLVGCMRTIKGFALDDVSRSRKKSKNMSQWHIDIEGACAEMAFARLHDRYWSAAWDSFKEPDVGPIQIRHTDLDYGCLVLRPADADDEQFALVVGATPTFKVIGWIKCIDGKQPQWQHGTDTSEPYWRVPQDDLRKF